MTTDAEYPFSEPFALDAPRFGWSPGIPAAWLSEADRRRTLRNLRESMYDTFLLSGLIGSKEVAKDFLAEAARCVGQLIYLPGMGAEFFRDLRHSTIVNANARRIVPIGQGRIVAIYGWDGEGPDPAGLRDLPEHIRTVFVHIAPIGGRLNGSNAEEIAREAVHDPLRKAGWRSYYIFGPGPTQETLYAPNIWIEGKPAGGATAVFGKSYTGRPPGLDRAPRVEGG